jgi:hypothetical protein
MKLIKMVELRLKYHKKSKANLCVTLQLSVALQYSNFKNLGTN